MKRLVCLSLCLVILTCSLAVPVSAAALDASTFNFTVTRLVSTPASEPYDGIKMMSVYYNAYFTNSAVIIGCNASYVYGRFWDESGRLCNGKWVNTLGAANASLLGVFPLSGLELVDSGVYSCSNVPARYLYFSKALAEQNENYITGTFAAVDWERTLANGVWYYFVKSATNTVWDEASVAQTVLTTALDSLTKYYAAGSDYVLWDTIPEGGTPSGSGGSADGDTTTAPYISVSCAGSVRRGSFFIPTAELMNSGDVTGDIACILSGYNSAYTKITASTEMANAWVVECGSDETADTLTLTFYVLGRPDISTVRTISVTGSASSDDGNSDSTTATEATEPTYSGGDDADDFNDTVNDQKDDFDESMDVFDDMTYPSYEDFEIDFSDILDGDEIHKITEFFSAIFENSYIKVVFFIAFALALMSFAFFGKR